MKNKKTVSALFVTLITVVAIPVLVAWQTRDTQAGTTWLGRGWLSDKIFAERVSGQYFNAGTITLLDPNGLPVPVTRGFSWIVQEDGTYIHEDSGAFETEAFFDVILAPYGLALADLGIDVSGVTSTGIGRWKRIGRRATGITFIKYKYSSTGKAIFVFVVKQISTFDEDFVPTSTQLQIAYYNLVDLVNPFTQTLQPALTVDQMNAIVDPDPANRPQPWFCFTQPEPDTENLAVSRLLPIDETLTCP